MSKLYLYQIKFKRVTGMLTWMCLSIFLGIIFLAPAHTLAVETDYARFPLQGTATMTQGYGSGMFSHYDADCHAIDITTGGKRIVAPFNLEILAISVVTPGTVAGFGYTEDKFGHGIVVQSTEPVLCADGQTSYVLVNFVHDRDISNLHVGDIISKGEAFYDPGDWGLATGVHSHIECARYSSKQTNHKYTSYFGTNSRNFYAMKNSIAPDKIFFLEDGYNAIAYSSGVTSSGFPSKVSWKQISGFVIPDPYLNNWSGLAPSKITSTSARLDGWFNYTTSITAGGCFLGSSQEATAQATADNHAGVQIASESGTFVAGVNKGDHYSLHFFYTTDGKQSTSSGFETTLAPATTYFYKFYATSGGVTTYSDVQSFTTSGTAGNLSFAVDGGGAVSTSGGAHYGNEVVSVSATPSAGYAFSYWSSSNGGTFADVNNPNTTFTMPSNDTTVTAHFVQQSFALMMAVDVGGSIDYNVSGGYVGGSQIAINAYPSAGYDFSYWTSSNGGSFANDSVASTAFTMPNAATTVTAHFTLHNYALSITASAGGTITSAANGAYPYSTDVTISAQANIGFKFDHWSSNAGGWFKDASSATTTFSMPMNDVTLTANFVSSITGLSFSAPFTDCKVSALQKLPLTVTPATASTQNITWTSSDTSIATVSQSGIVTGRGAGVTTITATAGSVTASTLVVVGLETLPVMKLPADVKTVKADAFSGTNAAHIIIPEGCETLDASFTNCPNLVRLELPSSLTSISGIPTGGTARLTVLCPDASLAAAWADEHGILHKGK